MTIARIRLIESRDIRVGDLTGLFKVGKQGVVTDVPYASLPRDRHDAICPKRVFVSSSCVNEGASPPLHNDALSGKPR